MRFHDKVVVVTGAASGIGKATALRFATEGARVACLDVNEAGAEATAIEIRDHDGQAGWYDCDVTSEASVDQVVNAVAEDLGPPSVCCNIAGIFTLARAEEQPVAEFRRIVEVNLVGSFIVSRACLPYLLRNRGCIVNMSSSYGILGQAYGSAYCASKGGVALMTRAMAVEYNRRGVRVNAIAPNGVDTAMGRDFVLVEGTDPSEYQKTFPPTAEMVDPGEVAAMVAFLASEEAGHVSGAVVPLDMAVTA